MARFISDQNKLVLLHESGTYANTSGTGYWIGQVTENSVDDAENKIIDHFLGKGDLSYSSVEFGPRDVTGTISYNAQDMRLLFWAIGSVNDATGGGAANYVHYANQVNTGNWMSPFTSGTDQLMAPISFTLEDSKQSPGTGRNFVRTINGCVVNQVTLTASQGEKVKIEADYIGQTLKFSSGNTTALTEVATTPYLWNNCSINAGGSVLDTIKEFELVINNNMTAPHYINGSRDIAAPYPGYRDITLNLTLDLDGDDSPFLYNGFYKVGSQFNVTLDMNGDLIGTTGSKHSIIFLSGCRITSMENPTTNEGAVETTIEIRPQSIIGSAVDTVIRYNAW